MHRPVIAHLKAGRYCDAIAAARSWLECTSYPQLSPDLAGVVGEERTSLLSLAREVLAMGGPLGGPLWGAPALLHLASAKRPEALLMPPQTLPRGVVRAGWLSAELLDSDMPVGFVCKPDSITVPTDEVTAAVLVLQTVELEAPELADDFFIESMEPIVDERQVLSARVLLPWIEALEATQIMLRGAREAAGEAVPATPNAGAGTSRPLFLPDSVASWALAAGRTFAAMAR